MRARFGGFVLDSETRELLKGDELVPLSPKAFELLCILVDHQPKALAKSDLQDRLWPNTFVVEKNLTNLISEIRAALDDDPSNPRFIRTVQRFGYAFRETPQRADGARHKSSAGQPSFVVRWAGGRVRLEEGEHILGRDPDAAILVESPGVSRRHARLTIAAGRAVIEDLGSKNGTFVGDLRVKGSRALGDGDTIAVGSVTLTFNVLQLPRSTETEAR